MKSRLGVRKKSGKMTKPPPGVVPIVDQAVSTSASERTGLGIVVMASEALTFRRGNNVSSGRADPRIVHQRDTGFLWNCLFKQRKPFFSDRDILNL